MEQVYAEIIKAIRFTCPCCDMVNEQDFLEGVFETTCEHCDTPILLQFQM